MIEKYRIANNNIMPVLEVVLRPLVTQSPIFIDPTWPVVESTGGDATPLISVIIAKASGIITSAVSGESFFVMMTYINAMIMT
jgi:hypothetical protein